MLVTLALLIAFLLALAILLSAIALVMRRSFNISSYMQLAMLGLALVASTGNAFARPLGFFPFTLAIRCSTLPASRSHDLVMLALGTLVTAVLAGFVFTWADRRALQRGLLAVY